MCKKLLFLLLMLSVKQINAQFCFTQSYYSTVPPNNNAFSVVSADFNKDGKLDVIATSTMSTVAYFQGNGNGTFASGIGTGLGSANYPNGSITADFNLDGNPDFASANVGSNSVSVLLGTGTGSFQPAANYNLASAKSLRAGDFNADGNLDLAVVGSASNQLFILIGSATGTFTNGPSYSMGATPQPYDVCVLDFNNDGKKDLVTANFNSNNASLFIGNGNGTFQTPINLSVPQVGGPYGICNYDFNQDGNEDFVITTQQAPYCGVICYSNGSTGLLSSQPLQIPGASQTRCVNAGDFNNDGNIDLLFAHYGSNNIGVLAGPAFGVGVNFGVSPGNGPRWLSTGDFNGDGKLDFAESNNANGTIGVYINTLPFLTLSSNATICNGNSTVLIASGASTYTWSTTDNNDTITVSPSSTTVYTVSGTNAGCPYTSSKTVTVTVNPTPTITINSSSTTICSGQQETLTASGANTYTWSGGISNGIAFTPTATAAYSVNATDLNGCSGSNNITIVVNATPTVTINSSANTVCVGTPVTITASGAVTYTWTGGITNGVAFTPTTTSTYSLIADNGNGCTSTVVKTITVNPLPTLSITATPTFVCHGTPCTLTASGNATSYVWNNGVSNGILFYPTSSATYSVVATDANGCVSTGTKTVNVSVSVLAFSVNPQNGIAPLPVTITNSTPGLSNYTFTWFFGDGSSATNSNASVFYTYNFAGLYDVGVIATNTVTGCKDTLVKPAHVNVSGSGCSHTASVTPSGPLSKCVGDTVTLTAVTNAPPSYTTQWNFNGVTISGATTSTISVTQSGYYSVTITKSSCPVTSSAVQISFATNPPQPTITSQGSIIPCVASVDTLICSPISGVTYLWNTSQTTPSITVSSAGVYNVTVTNISSCTATASYTVVANMPVPNICLISDDSSSTNNIIYWEKTAYPSADSFIVYREVSSNVYKRIGAVSKDSLSQFVDVNRAVGPANGDPNIGYYHYKLQVRDNCGSYSALSPYHSSVYFVDNMNGTFTWNIYDIEGSSTPVANYNLMRDSANINDWRSIGTVAGTTSTLNDPTYFTYQFVGNWRVDGVGFTCTPTMRYGNNYAASTIVRSKSNISNNRTTNNSQLARGSKQLLVYPNPGNGNFNLTSEKELGTVIVYNSLGEIVYQANQQLNHLTIDLSKQTPGIYILQAQGKHLRLIKE